MRFNLKSFSLFLTILFIINSKNTVFSMDYFDRGAKIKIFIGKVEIGRNQVWMSAKIGMKLKSGDKIRTFTESIIEIETSEGSVLKINENTTFELTDIWENRRNHQQKTKCRILTGGVWANIKKLTDKRSDFSFETPTATAAIRGTVLDLAVKEGKTRIRVYSGTVFVVATGSNAGANVFANQMVIVAKGQKTVQPVNMQPGAQATPDTASKQIDTAKVDSGPPLDTALIDTTGMADTIDECEIEILAPREGQDFSTTIIDVKGKTSCPNSKISINNIAFVSDATGNFIYQLAIPDECNSSVPVEACIGGNCKSITISYTPPCADVELKIESPANGQTFTKNIIPIIVKSNTNIVTLNGKQLQGGGGTFVKNILISDRTSKEELDISTISVEAEKTCCTGETKEASSEISINIQPDITNKTVNTISPEIKALNLRGKWRVLVYDATSKVFEDEEITLEFSTSTGENETYTLAPNEGVDINLIQGKDIVYTLVAKDKALNTARFVSQAISYLSQVPKIEMINPPNQGDYFLIPKNSVPPLPPSGHESRTRSFSLQFRINIPGDEYRLIEEVAIVVSKLSGGIITNQTFKSEQITDVDFDIDLELAWNADIYTYTINAKFFGGVTSREVNGRIRVGK